MKRDPEKLTVAHINDEFFNQTETFIYNYISHIDNFHIICLTSKIINLDQFPFPEKDIYNIRNGRYSFIWFLNRISNKNIFLEKLIRKRRVELIHAHYGYNGFYLSGLKQKYHIPLITSFYGYDMSRLIQQKKWQERYRILFDKGDIFLVEGLYMKSALLKLGCPQEKIQIQRIAIPLDKINFLPRRPKRNNEKVILIFSGRFVEKKGLLYALKAVEKVKEDGRNIEFRVIGNGILKAEIERFIQIHRMGDYARLLGFLPYENYLKEMQKADIFILPSITAADGDSEGGAPTVILEAQAMGMPIISTYHGDIPNVVIPGKSALLSEEKNIGQLATNIAYLLDNQQIWETMGCCGREFVENYHDIRLEAERLEDKYRFIIQDLKKNTITYA